MSPRELLARLRELNIHIDPGSAQLPPHVSEQDLPRELQQEWETHQEQIASILAAEEQGSQSGQTQKPGSDSPDRNARVQFWKNRFGGEIPIMELPWDRPRPAVPDGNIAEEEFTLPAESAGKLREWATDRQFSPNFILLAGFYALLFRYSQQAVQVIGVALEDKPSPGREPLASASLLPLKIAMHSDDDIFQLATKIRDEYRAARTHVLPPEELQKVLGLPTVEKRHPLYAVLFEMAPQPDDAAVPSGKSTAKDEVGFPDLAIHFAPGQLDRGRLRYRPELFDPETVRRMIGHLQTLLTDVTLHPEKPLHRWDILTGEERRQILVEWNQTTRDYPRNQCLHQLFEEQVHRTPDAVAVEDQHQRLTYGELNEQANRLANHLLHLGVQPEQFVGICLERGVDMVVALLAVMKAGAAYVPLDPAFPRHRLRYMLADADVRILLTQQHLQNILAGAEVTRVFLDRDRDAICCHSADPPDWEIPSEQLLYVIYTSGSTGKPKGVQISHRSVVNFLLSMGEQPGLCAEDVLLSVTTLSFDIAVLELYLPLLKGARVVIAERAATVDGIRLKGMLARHGVTIMQATPATWRLLIEAGWHPAGPFKALCGGEPLPQKLCDTLLGRGVDLWNMYGPTETTVWSTCEQMRPDQELITIGRPIANTQIFILDRKMQPVPPGVTGELFIGGDGLSRGYLNRNELTAERFLTISAQELGIPATAGTPDSFRLYKTGDLARYRRDGRIECLGRTDFQVKIRGFRIELGEIETLLNRHPGVKDGVVVAREDDSGHKQLVAYIIPKRDWIARGEVREFLQQNLPDYMVPTRYVFLETLPLTPNGKIDRKALPAPDGNAQQTTAAPPKAGRDELERQLIQIFQEVLKTQPVAVDDNFFEIGGHSLLAPRLFARIEEVTGKHLPLSVLFHAPTVADLAREIRQYDEHRAWSSLVPIQTSGNRPPLFCVHGAGGNVLIYRDLAKYLGDDQPVYGLQSQGLDGSGSFYKTIEEMAAHYIREIKNVAPRGPYYLSGYCLGGTIALEMAQQLVASGEEVAMVAMFETYNVQKFNPLTLPPHAKALRLLQNIYFHFRNFSLLSKEGRRQFFREKWAVSRERLVERIRLASGRLRGNKSADQQLARYPHILLGRINDEAEVRYRPAPYPGRITLFCPAAHFAGEEDPRCGWGEIARGGLDIQTLPLFPKGMMVAPFVQLVAIRLRACMDNARNTAAIREN